ncbi:hypothetical protein HY620_02095, partial [Candidatus Uhrbacteria bacterium]|nr:hypothetical protein [Candidatus Uhrbacteria bacterium]
SLYTPTRKIIFEELPTLQLDREYEHDLSNKELFKKILTQINAPHTTGKTFHKSADALEYATTMGFPLVVKPQQGSLSRHTFCNITSVDHLRAAIAHAQTLNKAFIVERYIAGDVFRATLVNATLVAACWRERPNVIGDGISTIAQLRDRKNASPLRGNLSQKNTTLHKIPCTDGVISFLAQQGLTLESVPPQGQKVYLHEKVILACGADIHDVTDALHGETRELLERVARRCHVPLIGFDLIASDISMSYRDQPFAILEANTKPFIDMHHYPVTGKSRNVAGALLDFVVAPSSSKD